MRGGKLPAGQRSAQGSDRGQRTVPRAGQRPRQEVPEGEAEGPAPREGPLRAQAPPPFGAPEAPQKRTREAPQTCKREPGGKRMNYRKLVITVTLAAIIAAILPVGSASAAPSPWWQLLTASRPSNLAPQPADYEQEITVTPEGGNVAGVVELEGKPIACLGTGFIVFFACPSVGLPASETAPQLQAALEGAFGAGTAEVSGGPVGGSPFKVVLPERGLPEMEVVKFGPFGSVSSKLIAFGGSGRLVVTATNLGDAPADGSAAPLAVVDELPEGLEATGVAGLAGQNQKHVDCSIEAGDRVACSYEEALPSFEALEIEV